MADLVVGLSKFVVEGVLTKAKAAIEDDAKLRESAQRDLVFITGEIEMMHEFLNIANEERVGNKVVRTWVKQVRELAYDVEDCIEFVIHLDTKTTWWLRFRSSLPMPHLMCMAQPPAPLPLDVAVAEIEQLKARVQDVSQRNSRYSLISDSGSKSVIMHCQQPHQGSAAAVNAMAASNMLDEARDGTKKRQQQGFGDLTQLIMQQQRDDKDLQVISVWGACGDHGTTSIIRNTYNDSEICINFAKRSWVKLMHPFNPDDLIRNAMVQFFANSCKEQDAAIAGTNILAKMKAAQEDLFKEFMDIVTKERYLVVLEGLSNMVEWDVIRRFLPHGENGSCIIVTAQQSEIASLCIGQPYQILELKRFSDEHSVCALFKGSQADDKKLQRSVAFSNKELKSSTLVGRESEVNALRKYPANARVQPPSIMSVWGMPGVGKSTLVKNLYDDITDNSTNFNKYRWVNLSRPFNLMDFYQSLLPNFHREKNPIEECHHLLANFYCLIVIDELRSKEEWDLIQDSLVYKDSKSVIVVITTEASIARYCTKNKDLVFYVRALEEVAANYLFRPQVHEYFREEQQLLLKCGGLPKVIATVAGVLARKMPRIDTVRSLNDEFMHHLETNPDYDGLRDLISWMHSYFRTFPDSLKPFIFYLSIFPPEQIIRRRRLVRRWIAEGYSRDGHDESAEQNGEKRLSELLELSIIQQPPQLVTTVFSDTRMDSCHVNGFIREYIILQRIGENLVIELGENCILTTQRTGRHLIILEIWKRDIIVFESMDFSRLRSLTVFGKWESFFMSPSMKMLRVLDLENASDVTDCDIDKMVKLFQRLKFMSLRGRHEIRHLPSSLGDLRQLQTLDVRGTSIVTLPHSISKLQKVQYIRAGSSNIPASIPPASSSWFPKFRKHRHCLAGVVMPRGIRKLTALHTLGVVNVGASGKAILEDLKKLTQLRKLGVSGINMKNSKDFMSAITGHVHLESLSVHLDNDNEDCLDDISLPCENLRSLKLYGLQDKCPLSNSHLSKLRKLDLEMATFEKNVMEFLARLPELCILHLRVKQLQDGKLYFYADLYGMELGNTFKKVKILQVTCSSGCLHVTFGSKSMKNLELLQIDCTSALYRLTGQNDLWELKQVLLKGTMDETMKRQLESQFANHPNTPAVKLEE